MDKITKLPWKATRNPFDVNDFHVYIIEKDLSIADGKVALVENITDAEYICRAVNSHEGLVLAARWAVTALINLETTDIDAVIKFLEEAIKAADGEGVK